MIALLQRVSSASVDVADERIANIGRGLLVFIGVERSDDETAVNRLLERVLTYRIFPDDAGKMNQDVLQIHGNLLLVPQFTLAADTQKGTRASFTPAAEPVRAKQLFERMVSLARERRDIHIESGRFAADMRVSLVNEGPVTFWLEA